MGFWHEGLHAERYNFWSRRKVRVCAGLRERLFTVNKILLDGAAESLARNLGERSDKWTMWGKSYFCEWIF